MAPIPTYSGGLASKKKAELQEIAAALKVSEEGTREELQTSIRRHLDVNEATLIENPVFSGLFGRRKRSVPPGAGSRFSSVVPTPEPEPATTTTTTTAQSSAIVRRRIAALEPIHESTPIADMRDVSTMLKRKPLSPSSNSDSASEEESPQNKRHNLSFATPSSLPPLPPTPSPMRNVLDSSMDQSVVVAQQQEERLMRSAKENVDGLRDFLSDSLNIWSLTALAELFCVLLISITWSSFQLPLAPSSLQTQYSILPQWVLTIPYPALSTFTSSPFWRGLLHWSLPTVLIPAFIGSIVSFTSRPGVDPLTASIIRLAAHVAYPYATSTTEYVAVDGHTFTPGGSPASWGGPDILGFRTRVLTASVNLAFAFAEAITTGTRR